MLNVIFMGTPDFAVPTLQALMHDAAYRVTGVVTQPDRPAGRGKSLQASPIKVVAAAANLPILQPEKLSAPFAYEQLQALQPDLIIVAAFGQILRQRVLDLPRYGCLNVHASLLPRWRGAAPIQAAIRAGDVQTGITIMRMDAGLDTGPMLAKRAIPILPSDTAQTIHDRLAAMGGELLIETLPAYIQGQLTPEPQNHALFTYAPMINKADGQIDWSQSAVDIDRLVRAFAPWPSTYTLWKGQLLKIMPSSDASRPAIFTSISRPPIQGQVVREGEYILVGTGKGWYVLSDVQLAGRSAVSIQEFVNGYPDFIGSRFG